MSMDPKYKGVCDPSINPEIDVLSSFTSFDHHPIPYIENEFMSNVLSLDPNIISSPFDPLELEPNNVNQSLSLSPGGDQHLFRTGAALSPDGGESSDFSSGLDCSPAGVGALPSSESNSLDPMMKYISDMLMEENIEDEPHMLDNLVSLNATEKSLYDVIGEQYPPLVSSNQAYFNCELADSSDLSASNLGGIDISGINASISARMVETIESVTPLEKNYQYDLLTYQLVQPLVNPSSSVHDVANEFSGTSVSAMVQKMFDDRDSILLFNKGLEEASKFLPYDSQLVNDFPGYPLSLGRKDDDPKVAAQEETIQKGTLSDGSRSRKTHGREDPDIEEGRTSKQSAVSAEENVSLNDGTISDMFDKVLLFAEFASEEPVAIRQCGASKSINTDEQSNVRKNGRGRPKKHGKKREIFVDLRTLLILCAEAMSTCDFKTTNELLKQIRQHSSPRGDGSQRLAHYFASGLQARLAGCTTGAETFYETLVVKKTTAGDLLKAFQTLLTASPFMKLSIYFACKVISDVAEKARILHIVDFGVLYGYHWPTLIQFLSARPGGPPKLRITAIERPQRGFRPAERIEETGRRLGNFCKQFNVPFEYHPIAEQHWENIRLEDLKINSNEFVAVNCLYRLRTLFDETGEGDCPRDAVLKFIRKINPKIFVYSEVSGSYNSPFFAARFKEALFHFSSVYDIFDSTLPRDNPERLLIEAEYYGREAMNVIACEGLEWVERPESYKQLQARTMKAGFKQFPLDLELLEMFRKKFSPHYHKDFVLEQDGRWMLQGWKGRILYASSCWVPS